MDKRYFSEKIVKWYQMHRRELPWRDTKDPYKIWLSEILLQQTRVAQGLPYYRQFIVKYPTVERLASAPVRDVLRLWQGLGYYTRARNLHKCARVIRQKYAGQFPRHFEELRSLPGIGDYTAAAVASIAFGEPVAVVDGNVFRLLSRVFGVDIEINSPQGKRAFAHLANQLIMRKAPDLHNQAVMEFGALVCTPKNPACTACIFKQGCFAYKNNMQSDLPVKIKARASRRRYFYYFVMQHDRSLMMQRREHKDIWMGLFDFHLVEKSRPRKAEKIIEEKSSSKLIRYAEEIRISRLYKHVLTHQTIFTRFIVVKTLKRIATPARNQGFYTFKQVERLPKPVLVDRFLADRYLF